jgi:hypothetical protein
MRPGRTRLAGVDRPGTRISSAPASIEAAMRPPVSIFRQALAVILVISPLVASTDLCTLGALTGRAELACAMESGGPDCRLASRPAPKCSHCAPATPGRETPRPHGPTCCELRPQAENTAGRPSLTAPPLIANPAVTLAVVDPVVLPVAPACVASDDGGAPPGGAPVLRSPRAPPLG